MTAPAKLYLFDRPAVFISSLAPGYIAGGSQCTLAYLQAISSLHSGRVTYLGPPWLMSAEPYSVKLQDRIEVPERPWISKARHWLIGDSADRISPEVLRFLQRRMAEWPVVYFNGDAAGAGVKAAQSLHLETVFIPHNFAPEYILSEGEDLSWFEQRRAHILARGAIDGFLRASARICLTDQDRDNYLKACSGKVDPKTCIGSCYFAYQPPESVREEGYRKYSGAAPVILFNTNLALRANLEGIVFFLENIWPQLDDISGLKLVIAGRAPLGEISELVKKDQRIELLSRPEPDEMERCFERATICMAIAFRGSGIKLRIAEALRRGVPVIASEHCARGYEQVSPVVLRIFRQPEDAIRDIKHLLKKDKHAIAKICLHEHEQNFGFNIGVERIRQLAQILG